MNHAIKGCSIDEFTAATVLLELNPVQSCFTTCKSAIIYDSLKPKVKPPRTMKKYCSISASLSTATPNQPDAIKQYRKTSAVSKDETMQLNSLSSPLFSPPSSPESILKNKASITRRRIPNYEIQPVGQPVNQQQPEKTRGKPCMMRGEEVSIPRISPGNLRFYVLRPVKPSLPSRCLVRSSQEPMEPAIFLHHGNSQIPSPVQPLAYPHSTANIASIARENTTDCFCASMPLTPYHRGESTAITMAKPCHVHTSTPIGTNSEAPRNRTALRCISCGCRSTPCWRPSWSEGKLCNPCGLRYSRNRVRCSSLSCSYIPTKTDICGRRKSECKKCHSELIYS